MKKRDLINIINHKVKRVDKVNLWRFKRRLDAYFRDNGIWKQRPQLAQFTADYENRGSFQVGRLYYQCSDGTLAVEGVSFLNTTKIQYEDCGYVARIV